MNGGGDRKALEANRSILKQDYDEDRFLTGLEVLWPVLSHHLNFASLAK
jgi:hypothetical protein